MIQLHKTNFYIVAIILLVLLSDCNISKSSYPDYTWDTLQVTATAYNSLPEQTTRENAALAAWGDTLEPGMLAIAVSRDLIKQGLTHNTAVQIKGLDGIYLVKDKMNKRWKKKIDIYMGLDKEKAIQWGKRTVTIYVGKAPEESL